MNKSIREIFTNVDGARIEGRLENVMQRRKEIYQLYNGIQNSTAELVEALKKDLQWTEIDALLEISVALQTLRCVYEHLDFKAALQTERLLAIENSNVNRQNLIGNVLIIAESSVPISQCILPLALAVAGGNGIFLLLSPDSPATSIVLKRLISATVDNEAIGVVNPEDSTGLNQAFKDLAEFRFHAIVTQSDKTLKLVQSAGIIRNSSALRVIHIEPRPACIIVTKTADLSRSAREIATAKFAYFSGSSSCAPGIVLVDEFAKDKFVVALSKAIKAIGLSKRQSIANVRLERSDNSHALADISRRFSSESMLTGGKIVTVNDELRFSDDSSLATLLVGESNWRGTERFPSLLSPEGNILGYRDTVLAILPTTSMEASIAVARQISGNKVPQSSYLFGSSEDCRYLSHFVPGSSTFVNSIPLGTAIAPYTRWNFQSQLSLFTVSYSIHATASTSHAICPIEAAISSERGSEAGLKDLVAKKLVPPKQRSGAQVGYFEQGGMVGLSHWLALFGVGGYWMWRVARRLLELRRM